MDGWICPDCDGPELPGAAARCDRCGSPRDQVHVYLAPVMVEVLHVPDRPLSPTAFGVTDGGWEVMTPIDAELARDLTEALAMKRRPVIVVERTALYPFADVGGPDVATVRRVTS